MRFKGFIYKTGIMTPAQKKNIASRLKKLAKQSRNNAVSNLTIQSDLDKIIKELEL